MYSTLLPFIIRAKKATYVGAGAQAPSSRMASHDLTYEEGDFTYRDSYFGGTDFLGQECVWQKQQPLWSMCYYGYILRPDLINGAEAATVLRAALGQDQAQGRLLENFTFKQGKFHFAIASEGTVEHFKGRETIQVEGVPAYALDYFGGLIKA